MAPAPAPDSKRMRPCLPNVGMEGRQAACWVGVQPVHYHERRQHMCVMQAAQLPPAIAPVRSVACLTLCALRVP